METDDGCLLRKLFGGLLGYSYKAFRQAVLLYKEVGGREFDTLYGEIASIIVIYRGFISLLYLIVEQEHVRVVIVTCGLRRIWAEVLKREGLAKKIGIIGGGRIADSLIVTAKVKAALVTRL